ncbi:unnamed protein product [Cylicostephanus goldi]|uniref:Uncharacterized protein n=1 Tax=Cylicostephanus goldi TaxID=71465 RepID=A0A3P6QQB9_CYLGO|nr:unnamed protein product [Cylicostephanus goldi]
MDSIALDNSQQSEHDSPPSSGPLECGSFVSIDTNFFVVEDAQFSCLATIFYEFCAPRFSMHCFCSADNLLAHPSTLTDEHMDDIKMERDDVRGEESVSTTIRSPHSSTSESLSNQREQTMISPPAMANLNVPNSLENNIFTAGDDSKPDTPVLEPVPEGGVLQVRLFVFCLFPPFFLGFVAILFLCYDFVDFMVMSFAFPWFSPNSYVVHV